MFSVKALALIVSLFSTLVCSITTPNTILIFARNNAEAYSASSGFKGYGIPYELVTVPQAGITLPTLGNTATGVGNYGGIVILGEVSYEYSDGFRSALTPSQWNTLYEYQTNFGVRMVRLDAYPTPDFGTTTAIPGVGCCEAGVDQTISISNSTSFPTAGMKTGATMSTAGLWHYPARITDSSIAWEVAKFGPGGSFTTETTAAVINRIGNRLQMVWFTSWATDWNPTSNFLQHAWIHWVTRGLYVGFRRVLFSTQVDDMFLSTEIYKSGGRVFRTRAGDMNAHKTWTAAINAKMPAGSNFFVEIGHNGNGDIISAVQNDASGVCQPPDPIYFPAQPVVPYDFQKPLGTGTNIWPQTPTSYAWSLNCARLDPLEQWFQQSANRDTFGHVSHTFAHMNLNNATYSDTAKEIGFNKAWMTQVTISSSNKYSGSGLIPPQISGLNNGDAIKAWMDNGVRYVVGDNTRPNLRNTESEHWPLITTVAANGYQGLIVIPRWATSIYYNCDTPDCTLQEWIDTSGGSGDFQNLLRDARATNVRHLLHLNQDPFMFHQANMRQTDMPSTNVNGVSSQLSLLQIWVEVIVQEFARLVTWPMITLKHDSLGAAFVNRMNRDKCKPNMTYNYSSDGKRIVGVTVTATGNSCSATIPVTFPGPITSNGGFTTEKIGSDPLTVWVRLSGSPVSFTLTTPISA